MSWRTSWRYKLVCAHGKVIILHRVICPRCRVWCAPRALAAFPFGIHAKKFTRGNMDDAPPKIQSHWRGRAVRSVLEVQLAKEVAEPSILVSKASHVATLPCDDKGDLLPLHCPIKCFKVFGAGVYCYMRWQRFMMLTFLVAFAFSLPNIVYNCFGSRLTSPN